MIDRKPYARFQPGVIIVAIFGVPAARYHGFGILVSVLLELTTGFVFVGLLRLLQRRHERRKRQPRHSGTDEPP